MFPAFSPPDWRLSDVKKTNESFCCLLFEAREDAAFQKKQKDERCDLFLFFDSSILVFP